MTMSTIEGLAALLYYDTTTTSTRESFELLTSAHQQPFLEQAQRVLAHIERLNLMLVPLVTPEESEERVRTAVARLTETIRAFLPQVSVFRREYFPCEELARKCLATIHRP